MPRKRFNAFDDFPTNGEEAAQKKSNRGNTSAEAPAKITSRGSDAAAPILRDTLPPSSSLFGESKERAGEPAQVERIERLRPTQMLPDRFQPRRLLPTALRAAFFSGQIDCYQAAHQWLQMAKSDAGVRKEVDRLLAMGLSFEEHGQIKPVTGSWVAGPNGAYVFQIETGERRFWAACLQYAARRLQSEPLLRVEVIETPTRTRQVLENRHAEPPSAVGQACEVASLILAELGEQPDPALENEFDFFRQWRARRMPTGMWEKITPVMQLTRERMVQLLNILSLPNDLLDLADRYRVPERVLREVLRAPENQWQRLLSASIQNDWTSDDVAGVSGRVEPVKEKKAPAPADPAQQALNAMKRFANALDLLDEDLRGAVLDELANDMVLNDQADEMIHTLRDLAERIRIRESNRFAGGQRRPKR